MNFDEYKQFNFLVKMQIGLSEASVINNLTTKYYDIYYLAPVSTKRVNFAVEQFKLKFCFKRARPVYFYMSIFVPLKVFQSFVELVASSRRSVCWGAARKNYKRKKESETKVIHYNIRFLVQ